MSSTPRLVLNGIRDVSPRTPVIVPEQLPQNLPLLFLFTERGNAEPFVGTDVSLFRRYGANSFDRTSATYTHATALANEFTKTGNAVMIRRLIPENATKAMLRVSVELVPAQVPNYARDAQTGEIQYTGSGSNRAPIMSVPPLVNGYRAIYHVNDNIYPVGDTEFGQAGVMTSFRQTTETNSLNQPLGGIKTDSDTTVDTTTTVYPIFDMEIDSEGSFGNRIGLRLRVPKTNGEISMDQNVMDAVNTYLYQVGIVERSVTGLTANIQETVLGEDFVTVSLRDDAVNPRTGRSIALSDRIVGDWSYDEIGYTPVDPIFSRVHVYTQSIDAMLTRLVTGEQIGGATIHGEGHYDSLSLYRTSKEQYSNLDNANRFNFFTGEDVNGVPYHCLDTSQSVAFGGASMATDNVFYAQGGNDGLPTVGGLPDRLNTLALLDRMVRDEMDQFGTGEIHYRNIPRYPFSTLWDSGFTMETKESLLNAVSVRKDVAVYLSTHSAIDVITQVVNGSPVTSVSWGQTNNESAEQARAAALSQKALLYPESTIDGTPCCRVFVVGHSGELIGDPSRTRVPLLFDLAKKVGDYMGNSNGRWDTLANFDEGESKIVETVKNINLTSKTGQGYDQSWANGLIWVEHWDRFRFFYPSFQTVYPDATSILNNLKNVMVCVALEKIAFRVWAALTGSTMSDTQLIEASDRMIAEQVADRFDGQVTVTPETYLTPADLASGNSWSCRMHVSGNVSKSVAFTTIVAHRASDLAAST